MSFIVAPAVAAAPLEPEVCRNLTAQRDELEARGVRQRVLAGPTAGLTSQQLGDVRLLMDLDGQLRFRCPFDQSLATLKDDPPEEGEAAAVPADSAALTPPPKPKTAQKKKSARPVAAVARDGDAGAEKGGSTTTTAPEAAPSGPPQNSAARSRGVAAKKANDAFRPGPDGDRNGTPLNQQATQPK